MTSIVQIIFHEFSIDARRAACNMASSSWL